MSVPAVVSDPHEPSDDPRLMSVREAAELCHVDYETFRRWIAKGVIEAFSVGPFSLIRVRRVDVQALVKKR